MTVNAARESPLVPTTAPRSVSAEVRASVLQPTVLEFQIAAARLPGLDVTETAEFTVDGDPVTPLELVGRNGSRIHRLAVDGGTVRARYSAQLSGTAARADIDEVERSEYLRPSRYAEADRLYSFAAQQFSITDSPEDVAEQVVAYVRGRLDYVSGSSDPTDGAVDTLLAGVGVCRDYAHLVVALLRAVKIPARLVSVYAPGLSPMDFHAVAEALIGDTWYVFDATGLAPRPSLVRIGTGRDAADTAFLDNHGGAINLDDMLVTAVVDGELPVDDHDGFAILG